MEPTAPSITTNQQARIEQILKGSPATIRVCRCGRAISGRRREYLRRKEVSPNSPAWSRCDLCAMEARTSPQP